MDTAGIFHSADSRTGYSDLWEITWERIVCFLPHLREELFKQTVIPGTQHCSYDAAQSSSKKDWNTVDLKSIHTPVKMLDCWNIKEQDHKIKSLQNYFHLLLGPIMCTSQEKKYKYFISVHTLKYCLKMLFGYTNAQLHLKWHWWTPDFPEDFPCIYSVPSFSTCHSRQRAHKASKGS